MASLSHVEREPRPQGAATAPIQLGARLRRAIRRFRSTRRLLARPCPRLARTERFFAPVKRVLERALLIGVDPGLPVGTQKRIRLCNIMALGGAAIMAVWAYIEAAFGDRPNLPWEVAIHGGLPRRARAERKRRPPRGPPAPGHQRERLRVRRCAAVHRGSSGRRACRSSGWRRSALLLFGPEEWLLASLGALLPALLFALCKSGFACDSAGHHAPAGARLVLRRQRRDDVRARVPGSVLLLPFERQGRGVVATDGPGEAQTPDRRRPDRRRPRAGVRPHRGRQRHVSLPARLHAPGPGQAGALDLRMLAPLEPYESELRRGPASVYERRCRRKDG